MTTRRILRNLARIGLAVCAAVLLIPAPGRIHAQSEPASTQEVAPLASFMRSNQGWIVHVSLPEPAMEFRYRIGEEGEFTDTGTSNHFDQRIGKPAPVTWFVMPPDQRAATIYITWRKPNGKEAGVFPVHFDPLQAVRSGDKQLLEQLWTAWIGFGDAADRGNYLYFTHLISSRCGIQKLEYAFDHSGEFQTWPVPECDIDDPHRLPSDSHQLYRTIPKEVKSVQVVLTYFDGTRSPERNFNVLP